MAGKLPGKLITISHLIVVVGRVDHFTIVLLEFLIVVYNSFRYRGYYYRSSALST